MKLAFWFLGCALAAALQSASAQKAQEKRPANVPAPDF